MENSLILQYTIVAALVLFAGYSLVKLIANNFSSNKKKKGEFGCDKECGH